VRSAKPTAKVRGPWNLTRKGVAIFVRARDRVVARIYSRFERLLQGLYSILRDQQAAQKRKDATRIGVGRLFDKAIEQ
jgi:hypothetical protein